jgi:hypothetical protein
LVKIEYLSSNGANGNNSSAYIAGAIPTGSSIVFLQPSFGGLDTPNLNAAKTVAPLVFSAQQRLVTKLDYVGFLAQLGYSSGVNVWGGEDNTPPMYGRLLFSINGIQTEDNTIVKELIGKIKERSMVTVLPEYVPPVSMVVNFNLQTTYDADMATIQPEQAKTLIQQELTGLYPIGSFNDTLTSQKIQTVVESYPGYYYENITDVELQYTVLPSTNTSTLNYKNKIKREETTTPGIGVRSSEFESPYYDNGTVIIYDVPILYPANSINPPIIGKLKLFSKNADGVIIDLDTVVGDVDYKTGIVSVAPSIANESFKLYVKPQSTTNIISKDEMYLTLNVNIEEPREI